MQAGLNPKLKIEWYEDLLRDLKDRVGKYGIILHAFSPARTHLHRTHQQTVRRREMFNRLKAAGLDSVPGGGAEILTDRVRSYIAPYKGHRRGVG